MRVTVFFITNPGPVQVECITYRIENGDSAEAVIKATKQAALLTTVPIAQINVVSTETKDSE